MSNNSSELGNQIRAFGPLRVVLIIAVIADIILRPEPGAHLSYDGILIVPNLLAPVLSPIFFMLLLLDSIMSMVYRSDKSVEVKARYLTIVVTNLVLAFVLIAYWLPFYLGLSATL